MSALADVRDPDCVARWSPLRFDMGSSEVSGAAAVLRRILYRWCSPDGSIRHAPDLGLARPINRLAGSTFSTAQLEELAEALRREAVDEDFVDDCDVTITEESGGRLRISASLLLVDGKTYLLAVSAAGADSALLAIGA